MPEQINWDYGEPIDALCQETAPNSQVFKREWTKATVEASSADPRFPAPRLILTRARPLPHMQMDCNSWTPTITMK